MEEEAQGGPMASPQTSCSPCHQSRPEGGQAAFPSLGLRAGPPTVLGPPHSLSITTQCQHGCTCPTF